MSIENQAAGAQRPDQTRAELVKLVRELGDCLKEELRSSRQASVQPGRVYEQTRLRRPMTRPRWDEQGHPICLHCGQPGPFRLDCPQRQQGQLPLNP